MAINADSRKAAVGTEAKQMIGRTPGTYHRPSHEEGSSQTSTSPAMMRYFIRKAYAAVSSSLCAYRRTLRLH